MTATTLGRAGAAGAATYVISTFLGIGLAATPDLLSAPDHVARLLADASNGRFILGTALQGAGLAGLLVLVVALATMLQCAPRLEARAQCAAALGLGATAVLYAALHAVGSVTSAALVLSRPVSSDTAALLNNVSVLLHWSAQVPLAVLLALTAWAGARSALLPRWHAVTAVGLGTSLLVTLPLVGSSPIVHIPPVLTTGWLLATGVVLMRTGGRTRPAPAATTGSALT